ncbi:uncharacterized protein [Chelonus insularis]|uniref:uncharacterized protein n=1 Tax=Chelonus insularis TaxID=460826 RepID=UPI00158EF200|nr:uncharacterized protein LOC118067582 [Chelonus insularis]
MVTRRKLSVAERTKLVCDYKNLKNYSAVARIYKISPEDVRKIIKKSETETTLSDLPRSGRPKVTSRLDDRFIVGLCQKNPEITIEEIREQLRNEGTEVSESTIRRRIHQAGFKSIVAKKKPLLRNIHKKKRLQFALKCIDKKVEF